MSSRKKIARNGALFAALVVALLSVGAFADSHKAQECKGKKGDRHEKKVTHMLDELDASKKQREVLAPAFDELHKNKKAMRKAMRKVHKDTMAGMDLSEKKFANAVDENRDELLKQVETATAAISASLKTIHKNLDSEQRSKMSEMMAKKGDHKKDHKSFKCHDGDCEECKHKGKHKK